MDFTSPPSESLLMLPPEIQLRILSDLPAKKVQSCRRVNKQFHQVIDLQENQGLALDPSIARSMQRFQDAIDRYANYTLPATKDTPSSSISIHDALFDFATLKTRTADPSQFWDHISNFVSSWLWQRRLNLPPGHAKEQEPSLDTYYDNSDEVHDLVETIVWAHLYWSEHAKPPWYHVDTKRLEWLLRRIERALVRAPRVGFLTGLHSEKDVENVFDKIEKDGKGFGKALKPGRQGGKLFPVLGFDVASLIDEDAINQSAREMHRTIKKLTEKLGVPTLQTTAPIWWFCTSQWALDEVQAVLKGEKVLDKIKTAAVLEEMCLA